jgi:predicted transport protein
MKSNQKVTETSQQLPITMEANYLDNAYLLKGNALYALSSQHRYSTPPVEKQFRSGNELERVLLDNSKTLFGEQAIIVALPKTSKNFFKNVILPNNFMLDMAGTPKFYFLDTISPEQNFLKDVFPRITQFFLFLIDAKNIEELAAMICKEAKKELAAISNREDMLPVVTQIIAEASSVLVFSERDVPEIIGVGQLYPQLWRQVQVMIFKKYVSSGDTFCSMMPKYIDPHGPIEKPKMRKEKVPVTEEYHFEGVSEVVKAAYLKIKEELLKANGQLVFNPQTYYIALKNSRNLAFFHFRKNKIDLVVKYPEKETRKLIKKHEVRPLKESIQKFWGGTACSIIVENSVHFQEVIGLLKKMISEHKS